MKILVGIQTSKIETDNLELLKTLIDLYSFRIEGYSFTSLYKKTHWDGKKKFISKTGFFRSGLLERLVKDINKTGIVPEIIKDYKEKTFSIKSIEKYKLHDYQEEIVKSCLLKKRGIIKSGTGSGKTIMMASLIKSLDLPTVIFFQKIQLAHQTLKFLQSCGISDIGICQGDNFQRGKVMLCTTKSIEKLLSEYEPEDFKVLLADECHEFSKGEDSLAIIQSFPEALYRFGLTATVPIDPIRQFNLEGAFGPVIESKSTTQLIEDGVLAKPIIQMITVEQEYEEDLSYSQVYQSYIVNSEIRNKTISDIIQFVYSKNDNSRILVIVENIEHGNILHDLIPNSIFIEGKDDIESRYSLIDSFLSSKYSSTLIGTKIIQTGINIHEITHFVNARGLKDYIPTIQALGRSMRRNTDKVYVYDFIDNVPYLKEHSKKRMKHYKLEGHEIQKL